MKNSIPENLNKVRHQIANSEKKYARSDGAVQLLAVSKTHAAEKVRIAAETGQVHFGENYLQEALEKIQQLDALGLTWHFIGPIQSNKTRAIAEYFQWVHSVEREKIARRLSEQRPAGLPSLKVLLQVNISHEASKAGVTLEALPSLAESVAGLPRLELAGLMSIPEPTRDVDRQRQNFRLLREARDELISRGHDTCKHLSMGMSNDFEAAIAEGATIVRIGTDIFGPREIVNR